MGEPNGMEEITQPEVMPGLPTTQEDSIQKFKAEMASEDEQQSDEPENNDLMTNFNMSPEGDTGIPITTGINEYSFKIYQHALQVYQERSCISRCSKIY